MSGLEIYVQGLAVVYVLATEAVCIRELVAVRIQESVVGYIAE